MATTLSSIPSLALAKHQENIMSSLAHRLEIARAANNTRLVELLEQEKQQLTFNSGHDGASRFRNNAAPHHLTRRSWLHGLKQGIQQVFSRDLQVHELVSGSDRWWYAFDPETGRCVYADSEAELRLWIKENYRGK
jgi:hypothetical protein